MVSFPGVLFWTDTSCCVFLQNKAPQAARGQKRIASNTFVCLTWIDNLFLQGGSETLLFFPWGRHTYSDLSFSDVPKILALSFKICLEKERAPSQLEIACLISGLKMEECNFFGKRKRFTWPGHITMRMHLGFHLRDLTTCIRHDSFELIVHSSPECQRFSVHWWTHYIISVLSHQELFTQVFKNVNLWNFHSVLNSREAALSWGIDWKLWRRRSHCWGLEATAGIGMRRVFGEVYFESLADFIFKMCKDHYRIELIAW